jgi:DNA-binding transcriptional regulator LsrR (DeoR family)
VGCADETGFKLDITQEMMSDALGLSVPHLNRMLSQLRAERMISINDHYVEFVNLRAIQLLAHYQPMKPARIPIADESIS